MLSAGFKACAYTWWDKERKREQCCPGIFDKLAAEAADSPLYCHKLQP